jgi:hypothetical protein
VTSEIERFIPKIRVSDDGAKCWLWQGYVDPQGYGRFTGTAPMRAHRWAYAYFRGPIPTGLVVDHICRRRHCVNPQHLRVVTSAENTHAPGSIAPAKLLREAETCIRGHPFNSANTGLTQRGYRYCKVCKAKREREVRAERAPTHCPLGHKKEPMSDGRMFCRTCHSSWRRKDETHV